MAKLLPWIAACALAPALAAPGCGGSEDASGPSLEPSPLSAVSAAVAALGGEGPLQELGLVRTLGSGKRYEPGQTVRVTDPPRLGPAFSFERIAEPLGSRSRVSYVRQPGEPFFLPYQYATIRDGASGVFDGVHGLVSGQLGMKKQAMRSDRVSATRKTERLREPQALLLAALHGDDAVTLLPAEDYQGRPHQVIALADPVGSLRIFLDAETHLPSKVDALEDDPVLGDALLEVRFDAWSQRDAVLLPDRVRTYLAGALVEDETRTESSTQAIIDEALLAVGDEPPEAKYAALGLPRSQFYQRYLGFGLDIDSFPSPPGEVTMSEVVTGSGIWQVTGAIHHSMVIEMQSSVVVVEAPIDDARSLAVIEAVSKRIPGKPITHLVNTHHHHDHSGGVRAYVAHGAQVVTAATNEDFFESMVAAPHTVEPDSLARAPKPLQLVLVGADALTIEDGRVVRVLPVATRHCEGMLMVHVPDAKVLFQSDLHAVGMGTPGEPLENPPVARMFVEGTVDLYDALVASALDVEHIVGGHGFGVATLEEVKQQAGH